MLYCTAYRYALADYRGEMSLQGCREGLWRSDTPALPRGQHVAVSTTTCDFSSQELQSIQYDNL